MAELKPFPALRYRYPEAGRPEDVCCPPYDIIPESERGFWEGRSPYNVIRLEKPAGDEPYAAAKRTLDSFLARGTLRQDDRPALYLYAQEYTAPEGERLTVAGLFAAVKLYEYGEGVVLPHENTLSAAKNDRYLLAKATGCQISPIYALYEDKQRAIGALLSEALKTPPELDFTMPDGVTHRLWALDDETLLGELASAFAPCKLYIADGHHRYDTALRLKREGGPPYIMMLLTDMDCPGLRVFPTHRVVRGLSGFDPHALLEKLKTWFDISPLPETERPPQAGTLGYISKAGRYLLTLRDPEDVRKAEPERAESYCALDVTMLHSLILTPLLGLDAANMARGENLGYTRDQADAIAQAESGGADCAFLLPPTQVRQIRDVSLDGEKMPQKSTYFYPKILTGPVMYRYG